MCTFLILFLTLIINTNFVRSEDVNEYSSSSNELSISSTDFAASLISENVTDASIDSTTEHVAVQKWRKAENVLNKLLTTMYKQILPFVLRGNEDLDLSPRCSRGLMKMLTGLKQSKLWAFKSKMLDFKHF